MPCAKFWGQGLAYRRGQEKTPGNTKNEGSEKQIGVIDFNCCWSRYAPEARCSRGDPLRRAKLRLVHPKTNLRRAKLLHVYVPVTT